MELLGVLLAAALSWAFGAVWYMKLGPRWLKATGLTEDQLGKKDPTPFIVSFVCAVIVAGMTRHIFESADIDGMGEGLVAGLGLGAFIAAPWLVTNVMFSQRDKALIWIDGGYVVGGSAIIGLVLGLFG